MGYHYYLFTRINTIPIFAIILCFTEANIDEAKKQLPYSMLSKVLFVIIALIICLSPCFLELYSTGRKYIFISQMIQKENCFFSLFRNHFFNVYRFLGCYFWFDSKFI
jgi:hypothetical protein